MRDHGDPSAGDLSVMVVDHHDLFRTGLRRLLDEQEGLAVVAAARNGAEAVRSAAELRPDVVVMDVTLPGMSGIAATRELRAAAPDSAILILTVSSDDSTVLDAVLAGATGYLLKDSTLDEIVRGIRAAAAGESPIAWGVAGGLLARLRHERPANAVEGARPALTRRELQVLAGIVAGHGNSEISELLHISTSTIKRHVSGILEKLDVENRIQAAVLAVRLGLLDGHDDRSS